MRIPIIPMLVVLVLGGTVVYFWNATGSDPRTLDVPKLTRVADLDGIETEVAIAPDGSRYAVIVSGDLWLMDPVQGDKKQLTRTPAAETFPAWSSDGKQIAFTRGSDTFVIGADSGSERLFRANATSLSWSSTGRTAFVRDRALWVANANDQDGKPLVEADVNPDATIQSPRFSPDALRIAFIKSQLEIRGEVWLVDTVGGMPQPLVSDRPAENPTDLAWIVGGRGLAYLTDRAGAYSIWYLDLSESKILPLTPPLVTVPVGRIGMGVTRDRIVVPRHFTDSNIVLSDGTPVVASEKLEFEPAVSRDGTLVAYTIAEENRFEIWTAGIHGEKPAFRTLGREPRFGSNNYEIVYTHADLSGNADIWKIDIRNGSAERVTDAEEIDVAADWSPDGQSIAFASARGGSVAIWSIPASGGKRLRISDAGYAPRYSPDSQTILFWNRQAFWTMDAGGRNLREIFRGAPHPTAGVWTAKGPVFSANMDQPVWPRFDVLSDGRLVVAPIDIHETTLWAIDLTYKEY